MLLSTFCISGLTDLSHPICLLGPDQVHHKPSSRVGFPWALYTQMEDQFFLRKISSLLMLQGSKDPVPPWPCCKGSAVLPSADTPSMMCHGAVPPLVELCPHPCSATCLPPEGGPGGQASILPHGALALGVGCCWGRCTRQKTVSSGQKVPPSPAPLKCLEAAANPGHSTAPLPSSKPPPNCSRGRASQGIEMQSVTH